MALRLPNGQILHTGSAHPTAVVGSALFRWGCSWACEVETVGRWLRIRNQRSLGDGQQFASKAFKNFNSWALKQGFITSCTPCLMVVLICLDTGLAVDLGECSQWLQQNYLPYFIQLLVDQPWVMVKSRVMSGFFCFQGTGFSVGLWHPSLNH